MDINVKDLVNDYLNGEGIYSLCSKYHIGKVKVKTYLNQNGIKIRNKGKIPYDKSKFVVENPSIEKYKPIDGFHYVAIDKSTGFKTADYMNAAGILTSHIHKNYGVEIPSLVLRNRYYMETGNYWWEQWFKIEKEKNKEVKKCPYCKWTTTDVCNKAGAFSQHIKKVHNMSADEYLKEHPEDALFFKKDNTKNKQQKLLKEKENFAICPLCERKFHKITNTHLKHFHNMDIEQFKEKYPNAKIMSDTDYLKIVSAASLGNMSVSKSRFVSSYENKLQQFLSNNNVKFEANRQILIGKEIDILIPDKKIGIEFDGLKWHTEFFGKKSHKYHLDKTEQCNKQGYGLIHIFEDEFVNKETIVYSKLKHILGISQDLPKIPGRKVFVKEIYSYEAKCFLEKYHIQGFYKSSVYLGGFYKNKLIAVMSFKNGNIKNSSWDLTRFATDYDYIYQGVGGKLFSYFVKNYNPEEIISFADRRWTLNPDNNLYTKLGFSLSSITKPDYKYYNERIDKYKRIHKMAMTKKTLSKKYGFPLTMTESEMAKELGYDRIWDCGLFKYMWKPNPSKAQ